MGRISTIFMTGVLLLLGGCVSTPMRSTSHVLDASEVQRLFAGKTVESVNRSTGLTSFTYYDPDGMVLQQRLWSKRTGKWKVKDNGKICLIFDKTSCRRIKMYTGMLDGKSTYYKIRKRKGNSVRRVVRYRKFVDGNRLAVAGQPWPKSARLTP
jgi:hypothetical protein